MQEQTRHNVLTKTQIPSSSKKRVDEVKDNDPDSNSFDSEGVFSIDPLQIDGLAERSA